MIVEVTLQNMKGIIEYSKEEKEAEELKNKFL